MDSFLSPPPLLPEFMTARPHHLAGYKLASCAFSRFLLTQPIFCFLPTSSLLWKTSHLQSFFPVFDLEEGSLLAMGFLIIIPVTPPDPIEIRTIRKLQSDLKSRHVYLPSCLLLRRGGYNMG